MPEQFLMTTGNIVRVLHFSPLTVRSDDVNSFSQTPEEVKAGKARVIKLSVDGYALLYHCMLPLST